MICSDSKTDCSILRTSIHVSGDVQLVVSLTQEALIRKMKSRNEVPKSKL